MNTSLVEIFVERGRDPYMLRIMQATGRIAFQERFDTYSLKMLFGFCADDDRFVEFGER